MRCALDIYFFLWKSSKHFHSYLLYIFLIANSRRLILIMIKWNLILNENFSFFTCLAKGQCEFWPTLGFCHKLYTHLYLLWNSLMDLYQTWLEDVWKCLYKWSLFSSDWIKNMAVSMVRHILGHFQKSYPMKLCRNDLWGILYKWSSFDCDWMKNMAVSGNKVYIEWDIRFCLIFQVHVYMKWNENKPCKYMYVP